MIRVYAEAERNTRNVAGGSRLEKRFLSAINLLFKG